MRLRPQTQCALRIVVALANDSAPQDVPALAQNTRTPVSLVGRALESLARARMVKGAEGGFLLGFHPRAINVADIIDATGALEEPLSCPLAHHDCSAEHRCSLCWTIFEAELAAMQVLRGQTVEDLCRTPTPSQQPAVRMAWSA